MKILSPREVVKLTGLKVAIIRSGRPAYKVAAALGWHPSKISQIISEKYEPSNLERELLAEELRTTVNAIFNPDQAAV